MYALAGLVEDVLATYPVGAVILTNGQYKEKQADGTWKVLGYSTTSSGFTTVGPTRQVQTAAGSITVSDLSFEQAQAKVVADAAAARAAAAAAQAAAAGIGTGAVTTVAGIPLHWLLLGGGAVILLLMGRR